LSAFQVFDYRQILQANDQITDTYGGGYSNLLSATGAGFGVDEILLSNSDTVDHVVTLALGTGDDQYLLGSVKVVAGSGHDGTHPTVSFFSLLPATLSRFNQIPGQDLYKKLDAAPSSGKVVAFQIFGGKY
jgi:hypothetical protein